MNGSKRLSLVTRIPFTSDSKSSNRVNKEKIHDCEYFLEKIVEDQMLNIKSEKFLVFFNSTSFSEKDLMVCSNRNCMPAWHNKIQSILLYEFVINYAEYCKNYLCV